MAANKYDDSQVEQEINKNTYRGKGYSRSWNCGRITITKQKYKLMEVKSLGLFDKLKKK